MNGNNMNSINHERYPIGNGNFYADIKELSIKGIYSEFGALSFCSLEYLKDNKNTFTKAQRIFNSARWHTRILEVLNPSTSEESLHYCAEIDDSIIPENNLFLRTFKSYEPVYFKLNIPPYAKLVTAPAISHNVHKAESFWIKIKHDNYEDILQISLYGECKLNCNDMILSVAPGNSAIIFAIGTIPSTIQRNSVRALHLFLENKISDKTLLFKEEKYDKIRNAIYALTLHNNIRGMVASNTDNYVRMLPAYANVRLFNSIGMKKFAKAICMNSLKSFLAVKDCSGIGRNKDPQFATDIFSIVPSLLWLCAFESPDETFLKTMMPFMLARCKLQARSTVSGMLSFEGREYYYNNFCNITDGSAVSTLLFIKSSSLLSEHSPDKEIKTAHDLVKNSFRNNFIVDSKIYLNSPKRTQAARLPKFIYGKCHFCNNSEFTWLTKNSAGGYCCDDCAEFYKSEPSPYNDVLKESYLPALWAVYIDCDIFTQEEVRYSQDLAVKDIESIPLCDAALLLYSMTKYPHKAQRQVYDHIISKRNSLGIWYDDKGEFDTLTNALCAISINKTNL